MAVAQRGSLLVVLILGAVFVACEVETPEVTHTVPPSTPEEFLERLEGALTRDGEVWHGTQVMSHLESGKRTGFGELEIWLDPANERGRFHFRKHADNTADLAGEFIQLVVGDTVYASNPGSDDPVNAYLLSETDQCLPELGHYLVARFLCGLTTLQRLDLVVVTDAEFDGRPAYGLTATQPHSSQPPDPPGRPTPPGGAPTPHPLIVTATRFDMTLYVDASSFNPLGVWGVLDSDPQGTEFHSRSDINGQFVDADSVDELFDEKALGYVTPKERDDGILENPAVGVPVYWLGREADLGNGLPHLELGYLMDRHPEIVRPAGSDEPKVRVSLPYAGDGGGVTLDLWQPGEWEKFKARLGGKFAWSWCSETVEKPLGDARLVILLGHEPPPHQLGQVTVVPITPGQPPPSSVPYTPTVPPVRTDPCPAAPYDRFMAEVHYPDVTVVINGTLFYGGQEGEHFGAFDRPDALETVAGALRLRKPGE